MTKRMYGAVRKPEDIKDINALIREEIEELKTKPSITERVKRSMYFITLTFAPTWKAVFAGKIREMRKIAKNEYTKTAKLANRRLKELKIVGEYDEKWGD